MEGRIVNDRCEGMQHIVIDYRGFELEHRIDVKCNSVIIFFNGQMVKCIAGDIRLDGTHNAIEKAKNWINNKIK